MSEVLQICSESVNDNETQCGALSTRSLYDSGLSGLTCSSFKNFLPSNFKGDVTKESVSGVDLERERSTMNDSQCPSNYRVSDALIRRSGLFQRSWALAMSRTLRIHLRGDLRLTSSCALSRCCRRDPALWTLKQPLPDINRSYQTSSMV